MINRTTFSRLVHPALPWFRYARRTHTLIDPLRVLERDIEIFTVDAGEFANRTYKRGKQLQCIGGSALDLNQYHLAHVRCINEGTDEEGHVNWTYQIAAIHPAVKIGKMHTSFEGWSYPGDPYVRAGSGIVRYELNLHETNGAVNNNRKGTKDDDKELVYVVVFVTAATILWIVFLSHSYQNSVPVIVESPQEVVVVKRRYASSDPGVVYSSTYGPQYTSRPAIAFGKSTKSE